MEIETPDIDIDVESEVSEAVKELMSRAIILYNDEVNNFGHVIECLMDFCSHTFEQAQQCALIVHNSGKYAVKQGSYEDLKPIVEALLENGLSATIE